VTWFRLLARWRARLAEALVRRRVRLGFVCGGVALWLARPTWNSLVAGALVALAGEGIRVWAAGHVEKSREVTASGPYRFVRHPLYLGSALLGVGFVIAAANVVVAAMVLAYLGTTIPAAIRAEEAHLREKFGEAYDAYADRRHASVARTFSWRRVFSNREHHTLAGLVAAIGVLMVKMWVR
jgi:protein-S-isoprenylcysteine O-methyltransferase Ste14